MGIKIFSDTATNTQSPNPDPYKFVIESITESPLKNFCLVLAKYYGCTTFNGKKLMLLKGSRKEVEKLTKLDPHLLGKDHVVIARFEPNKLGIAIGKKILKTIEAWDLDDII